LLQSDELSDQQQHDRTFATGLKSIDELLPRRRWARGAIHEILAAPEDGIPRLFPLQIARAAARDKGVIVWCDAQQELYPPAITAAKIPLDRLYLLRPTNREDLVWSIAECLRCRGVAATIAAAPQRLSRIEARRLQLAAERGGGVGILLRSMISTPLAEMQAPFVYAAATRWRIAPAPGERMIQRFSISLLHGPAEHVGQTVFLEHHHESNLVCSTEKTTARSAIPITLLAGA
jgi:protein ImuA